MRGIPQSLAIATAARYTDGKEEEEEEEEEEEDVLWRRGQSPFAVCVIEPSK